MDDLSIVLVGAAGQGIQTVEQFMVNLFKMTGYNVYATKEYMSRVRGGMNSTELRIGSGKKRVRAYVDRIDLLIPLHKNAIEHVQHRLSKSTIILTDPDLINQREYPDYQCIAVPFTKIKKEIGSKFMNVFAVGVLSGIFRIPEKSALQFIKQRFETKGELILNKNINSFNRGHKKGETLKDIIPEMEKEPNVINEILLDGNQSVGLGAIAGGCNFISAYPMSPSTGTLVFLAQHSRKFDIVVDQAEDEIAAINKAIGAWYTGARGIASTSGGGFSLMSEGLSLTGMIESPLVIHLAQRPGPATGLPTRTAQGDLNLALNAGHGEFHRIIFAPGSIEQAFFLTQHAFNLADALQIPVFILTDQYLVDSYYNVPPEDMNIIGIRHAFIETDSEYKRYVYTKNGISPRGVPGFGEGFVRIDSDEHDEWGHITEDLRGVREKMIDKRIYKKGLTISQIEPPIPLEPFGSEEFDTLVICWGSSYLIVKEALEELNDSQIAGVHFSQVFPVPKNTKSVLHEAKNLLLIEGNATGQFLKLLKLYTDIDIKKNRVYLKSNGEPFSVEEVISFIRSKIKGGK
ncbi:MAG: 2-oxoacid:acceptor oxidoreductase subunit alpha [Candidatus Lokiarchaeota archaeon]|nr:2-oxoacid:acceptor oxidoreductase subunit alpha [Candidatus Lokiarchaeota archaeon]